MSGCQTVTWQQFILQQNNWRKRQIFPAHCKPSIQLSDTSRSVITCVPSFCHQLNASNTCYIIAVVGCVQLMTERILPTRIIGLTWLIMLIGLDISFCLVPCGKLSWLHVSFERTLTLLSATSNNIWSWYTDLDCTKCNSPPINGQCTNDRIAI